MYLRDIITFVGDNTGHFLVLIAFYPGNLLVGALLVRCLFIVYLLFVRCLFVVCSLSLRCLFVSITGSLLATAHLATLTPSLGACTYVRDRNRGLYHISVTVRIAHSTSITC